jgi:hypothetical protein
MSRPVMRAIADNMATPGCDSTKGLDFPTEIET